MILESIIIQCPHCRLISSHYEVMSGTIFQSESYTDGKMEVISGAYGENPFMIRCRLCRGFYFYSDHISNAPSVNRQLPRLTYEEYYLKREDYLDAIRQLNLLSPQREKWLRIQFWWAINDLIRNDAGWGKRRSKILEFVNFILKPLQKVKWLHYRYPEYRKWIKHKHENLRMLLRLLTPAENTDDACLSVEIYRELREFPSAKKHLKLIPNDCCQTYQRTQKHLLLRRDRFVRRIQQPSLPESSVQSEPVLVTGD